MHRFSKLEYVLMSALLTTNFIMFAQESEPKNEDNDSNTDKQETIKPTSIYSDSKERLWDEDDVNAFLALPYIPAKTDIINALSGAKTIGEYNIKLKIEEKEHLEEIQSKSIPIELYSTERLAYSVKFYSHVLWNSTCDDVKRTLLHNISRWNTIPELYTIYKTESYYKIRSKRHQHPRQWFFNYKDRFVVYVRSEVQCDLTKESQDNAYLKIDQIVNDITRIIQASKTSTQNRGDK